MNTIQIITGGIGIDNINKNSAFFELNEGNFSSRIEENQVKSRFSNKVVFCVNELIYYFDYVAKIMVVILYSIDVI